MAAMETKWNDRQGHRFRQARAVLVTEDGKIHDFTGASIPGVCQSAVLAHEKAGKWSNTTYRILHRSSTAFVSWMDDWDTGEMWPQPSAEEGFAWLAKQAPQVSWNGFAAYIASSRAKTALRWQKVEAAKSEFDTELPCPHKADTAQHLAEIEAEIAAKAEVLERQQNENAKVADALARLRYQERLVVKAQEQAQELARQQDELKKKFRSAGRDEQGQDCLGVGAFAALDSLTL